MRRVTLLIIAFLQSIPAGWAASTPLSISATVLSKNTCVFKTTTATLAFGTLTPSIPIDTTVSTALTFRCMGSDPVVTYIISDDSGLYETGPGANRMVNTTFPGNYLPYSLTLSPATGSFPKETPPTDHTVTVTGKVMGTDYQFAYPGSYTDTVSISILP